MQSAHLSRGGKCIFIHYIKIFQVHIYEIFLGHADKK